MSDVLFIDADWDEVTQYGIAFRERFVFKNFASEWSTYSSHNLLRGTQAIQPDVDAYINSNNVKYISGMGHGAYDTFTGYENKPIWSASQDLSFLQGTLVHLLSCQTGALLGVSMVKQGVLVFWGYTVNFAFFHQSSPPPDLSDDKVAEVFLRMDCIIDRGILSKRTTAEIYESITTYVAQTYPQLQPHQQGVLLDNYVHLVGPMAYYGDANSTL
jgi:hypothetical protein